MSARIAVFDAWWPYRIGIIEKLGKSSTYVRWSDGETWRYDREHRQFLRRLDGGALWPRQARRRCRKMAPQLGERIKRLEATLKVSP